MSLSSHLLSRESFWACWQGNPALHSADTPTLPICLNTSPLLALLLRVSSLLNLLCLYFTARQFPSTCHRVFTLLLAYLFFLFLEAELVRDFHSWLADLKLQLKECSSQSGDVAILGTKLQRLKVLYFYTVFLMVQVLGCGKPKAYSGLSVFNMSLVDILACCQTLTQK